MIFQKPDTFFVLSTLKRHNHAKIIKNIIFIFAFQYCHGIICEHRLELHIDIFYILGCCGNVANVPKAPFISHSSISFSGHACPKLNFTLIFRLTGKCETQN